MNRVSLLCFSSNDPFWFRDTRVAIRVSAAEGQDGLSLIEHWLPHGEGPPPHLHRREDEVMHLLSGRLRMRIGGQDRLVEPGGVVLAPKGVPHSYHVESREGAHCLTMTRGIDLEALVRAAGRPAADPGLPPRQAVDPEDATAFAALSSRHHIQILGPAFA